MDNLTSVQEIVDECRQYRGRILMLEAVLDLAECTSAGLERRYKQLQGQLVERQGSPKKPMNLSKVRIDPP